MNDVSTRTGTTTKTLDEQIRAVQHQDHAARSKVCRTCPASSSCTARRLPRPRKRIEMSNGRTSETVEARKSMLESLADDARAAHRRSRPAADALQQPARRIDAGGRDARARNRPRGGRDRKHRLDRDQPAVRDRAQHRRGRTPHHLGRHAAVYQQGMQEADAMFGQAADRFASIVQNMRQMASEMQNELGARQQMQLELERPVELRRGVLEMPQEAAESTAQMRKVIVDQIEALAELNRIVARHGRGLDVAPRPRARASARKSRCWRGRRPAAADAAAARAQRIQPAPAGPRRSRRAAPKRRRSARSVGHRPRRLAVGAAEPRRQRRSTARPRAGPAPARTGRQSARVADARHRPPARPRHRRRHVDRYQRGERKAFSKRLYTPAGQKTFDEISRKYRADRNFKQTVDRYITEFERLLDDVARDARGPRRWRATSPRKPASSTPCSPTPRAGWAKPGPDDLPA